MQEKLEQEVNPEGPEDLQLELKSLLRSCYPGRLRLPQIVTAMTARGFEAENVVALIEKLVSAGRIQSLVLPDGISIYRCQPLAGGQTDNDVAEPVFEDWNRLLERLLGITDPRERIEAIANNAGASDTRDFCYWAAEQELVDSFGEFAELRFRESLAAEQRALRQAGRSDGGIGVSLQLKLKRKVLDECKILYHDALARIGTSSAVYANESLRVAVEKRTSETIDGVTRFEQLPAIEAPTKSGIEESNPRATATAERAARRQRIVMPILHTKGWTRGALVTESGVGKGTVYGYLNGTREWISYENGKELADTLGLAVADLPDVKSPE
jgi:hypothetical protein